MKRLFIALATMLAVAAPASANAKTGLEGRWKNGRMEIVIAPCGRTLCGTVVKASARQQARAESGSGTRLLGARLIDNIQATGPAAWRANVFIADRNMNTHGTIRAAGPNRLTVQGCVLAFICKTTHWDRVG